MTVGQSPAHESHPEQNRTQNNCANGLFSVLLSDKEGRLERVSFLLPIVVQTMARTDRKLTWVPVTFLLLHLWGTIRFFIELEKDLSGGKAYSSHHLLALELLQVSELYFVDVQCLVYTVRGRLATFTLSVHVNRPYFSRPRKYRRLFSEPTYWPRRSRGQYGEGNNQAGIFEAEGNKSLIPGRLARSQLTCPSTRKVRDDSVVSLCSECYNASTGSPWPSGPQWFDRLFSTCNRQLADSPGG